MPTTPTTTTTTTTPTTTKTTTPTTTTTEAAETTPLPDPDCDSLCVGTEDLVNVSNGCCTAKFCYCVNGEGYPADCNPAGTLFCQSTGECVEDCSSKDECC